MRLRRCRACNILYNAEFNGREALLCEACCKACEVAYLKIRDYFTEKALEEDGAKFRLTDKEKIAEITGTSAVYVWVLAKEGRLGYLFQRNCIHCDCSLGEDEREVCKQCAEIIAKRLSMAISAREVQIHTATETIAKNQRKYGLGKKE